MCNEGGCALGTPGRPRTVEQLVEDHYASLFRYAFRLTGVQADAEDVCRKLAAVEGICCGISAAGACVVALRVAEELENATIVFIVCDRGDRYLSTGVFPG